LNTRPALPVPAFLLGARTVGPDYALPTPPRVADWRDTRRAAAVERLASPRSVRDDAIDAVSTELATPPNGGSR
jgi:hypothetical protein